MKNIFTIFVRDLKRLVRSPFALVIALGLCILPSLYAWFNIYSNHDPYGNTSNIKIAIASADEGCTLSDGTYKNMGADVLKELETNDSIDWIACDTLEEAIAGVEAGDYYACVTISSDFTESMYTVFDTDFRHPSITYYENEKKNAIATKITDTAVGSLQQTINTKFIEVVVSTIFTQTNTVSDDINEGERTATLHDKLVSLQENLSAYNDTLTLLVNGNTQLTGNLSDTSSEISSLASGISSATSSLSNAQASFSNSRAALNTFSEQFKSTLNDMSESLNNISALLDTTTLAQDSQALANSVSQLNADITQLSTQMKTLKVLVAKYYAGQSESVEVPELGVLDAVVTQLLNTVSAITSQAGNGTLTQAAVNNLISGIKSSIDSCKKQIDDLNSSYVNSVEPQLISLNDSISQTLSSVNSIMSSLTSALNDATEILSGVETTVDKSNESLSQIQTVIANVIAELDEVIDWMDSTSESDKINMVTQFLGGDSETYGEFFAEPVNMTTEEIYPVENYGSGMTPFYTILALWVGGTLLVSLVKVHADADGLENVKPRHLFFGRYLTFFVLGQIQAAIVAIGDIHLLHSQVLEPGLFYLVAVLASFTFTLLIYSLAISFGDLGKALAVVVMVLQIAGSSGTFPIEMLPQVYRNIYIFFPFPYAINAMRETVAGMYGTAYIANLAQLMLFAVAALVIGLVIRIPFMKINHFVEERMEDTGMM
jgi:putative membrane protein